MSSYQFVNSLTSCYSQARQDPTAQDYYTPPVQAYGSCFNGPSSPVQPQTYGAPYSQHLQTQNGDPHHFSSCSQQQRLGHSISSQSPRTPTPSVTPVPSCKYAEPPTVHAASPQDLSTTSSSSQPPESPEQGESPTPTSKSSTSRHLSPDSSPEDSSPQQSPSPQQTSQQSPKGNAFQGNQPQIYPWMRKVHVGQRNVKISVPWTIWSDKRGRLTPSESTPGAGIAFQVSRIAVNIRGQFAVKVRFTPPFRP
ncbi:homeotic protein Sex combs reduced [Trichonephila clavipes]|nr:homeotic protein Sex combs reduced [Trichonephila clavipes]